MSIGIGIGKSLSNDGAAHAAKTDAVTAALQRVWEGHPAYSWVWTDEIRCRGCDARLEIPVLASTRASADKAFKAHQSAELDALLSAGGRAA